VWQDVDLLDSRFAEGDAVRVLGRVERYRDRLQLDVRAIEPAGEADPAELVPALRRDADELDGFLDFLAADITHPGLRATVFAVVGDPQVRRALRALPAPPGGPPGSAGRVLEHTVRGAASFRGALPPDPRPPL